jgi:predicted ATP-grasp superfamily ATP-dependent carboligase
LQLYVFDDLARQADDAIQAVERRLEVEIATRERLEGQVSELEARIRRLEEPQRRER